MVNGKIGLLEIDDANDDTRRWTFTAHRLPGFPTDSGRYRNDVGNMICWDRRSLRRSTSGSNAAAACCARADSSFSEYMMYGVFVREIMGYDEADAARYGLRIKALKF